MITVVRTFTIQAGKRRAAFEWAARIDNYINEHRSYNIQVKRNISGPANQLSIVLETESLAAWEELVKENNEDADFLAIIDESESQGSLGLFIGDHTLNLYETVSPGQFKI